MAIHVLRWGNVVQCWQIHAHISTDNQRGPNVSLLSGLFLIFMHYLITYLLTGDRRQARHFYLAKRRRRVFGELNDVVVAFRF